MSHTAPSTRPQDYAPPPLIGRWKSYSLTVGVIFSALAVIGWNRFPPLFYRSWLVAFLFWLGLTTGSLTLLMLQYTSGGNWGRIGRRFWEAASGNMLLMLVAFVPIVIGMKHLYPWTQPDVQTTLGWAKIHYYLNLKFFLVRAAIYFLGWGFLYWRLMRWSREEETGQSTPAKFVAVQNWSGFGIVFYAVTITFASIDWAMSLKPEWWSTVWGMLFMVGQVLSTLCFTIVLLVRLAPVEPLSRIFKIDFLHDFGKLMFAFVVLWAYLSFSQWLIIWSGNMLSEIRWYLMRLNGGWQYFGTVLIFVHFVFPFALLLSRSLKRDGRRVILIALLILLMRLVDLFWLTAPNFYPGDTTAFSNFGWVDGAMYVICPIALGGVWLFFFFSRLEKRALVPVNDPHFVEMLEAKHG